MATRRVVVEFLGDDKSLSKAADGAEKKTSKLGTTLAGVGKTAALGLAGGVAVGAVALVGMAKGAAEDEKAQAVLAKTLKNTASATDAQVASVEDYISKVGIATGVTDDEMRPALANLVRATGDVGKAQGLMNLALDVSAGTGKSLESVTMALSKAQNGSTGALGKLGIATKDASGKALSFEQIQKNLAKTFAGQAAAGAQTLDGKMARLKLIFAETQETIGAKLLPVAAKLGDWFLKKGIPAISSFAGWVERNRDVLKPLAIGLGGVTAAVWLLNIAMAANPISLVVIGIAALAAGLVVAYKRSETFRTIVNTAFAVVKTAINGVITVGAAVIKFFKDLPGTVSRVLGNTGTWLVDKGKALMNGLKNGIWAIAKGIGDWILRAPVVKVMAPWLHAGVWLVTHGRKLIGGLKDGIWSVAKTLGTWVNTNVIQPPLRLFVNAGTWLYTRGSALVGGLKSGITSVAKTIGSWVWYNVARPPIDQFAKAGTWLLSAGKNIVGGLLGGIAEKMKGIGSWIKSTVVDPMVKAVKDFFGIKSPSKVFESIGGHLIGGLMKGMGSGMGGAVAKKVFGDMPGALRAIVGKGLVGLQNLPKKALDALGSAIGGPFSGGGDPAPTNLSAMQALVRTVAAQRGWGTGPQWDALYQLVQHESGFNPNAQNPTSSAYGMFQFLNSTWGSVGATKTSDPWGQTIAGLRYIANAYGSPAAAWSAWQSRSPHWYEKGTPWVPNDQLAFLHKGEAVVPAEVNRRRMAGVGSGTLTVNLVLDGKVVQQSLVRLKKLNGGLELGLA